jgi:ABC-type antimicrobial peptide transport system permease subunit
MVKNARYGSLREPPEPMIYEALMQEERPSSVTLHVRAKGNPALLESRLRHELRQVDATLPVHSVRTIAQQIDRSLRQDRMMATLSGYFALLALFLTCLGLFGTVAYGVERRMREIGIRIALGGGRGHVLRVVLGDSLFLVGLGAAAGVLLAIASTRILESMLFGISPTSVSTVAGVVFLLFGTSALACYLPARRAAGLDPMTVLRRE